MYQFVQPFVFHRDKVYKSIPLDEIEAVISSDNDSGSDCSFPTM